MVPPASRHRAILELQSPTPLYRMSESTASGANIINEIVSSSTAVEPLLYVKWITTGQRRLLSPDGSLAILLLSFWGSQKEAGDNTPDLSYSATMPASWSPKMYLGAIFLMVRNTSLLSLESAKINGGLHNSINQIHWYFSSNFSALEILEEECAFQYVHGGSFLEV
jgi:hypothetical protein